MATRYAAGTDVPADRSRGEIERTLRRYGAKSLAYGWDEDSNVAMLGFTMHGRQVRFVLPMPNADDPDFTETDTGRKRTASAAAEMYEKAVKQKWRVLALIVKAKLEAVESGVVDFHNEFMPNFVLPGGMTVADSVRGRVAEAYATGQVPALLPDYRRAIEAGQS